MTHDEFKAIRRRLGYSQAGLAAVLGCKAESVRKYEMPPQANRRRDISEIVAQFMRFLDNLGAETVSRIMAEMNQDG